MVSDHPGLDETGEETSCSQKEGVFNRLCRERCAPRRIGPETPDDVAGECLVSRTGGGPGNRRRAPAAPGRGAVLRESANSMEPASALTVPPETARARPPNPCRNRPGNGETRAQFTEGDQEHRRIHQRRRQPEALTAASGAPITCIAAMKGMTSQELNGESPLIIGAPDHPHVVCLEGPRQQIFRPAPSCRRPGGRRTR